MLDGELAAAPASVLQEHVETCEACRAALGELQFAREALRGLPALDAPRPFRLRRADVERRPVVAAVYGGGLMRFAPALAAAALAVLVVLGGVDVASRAGSGGGTREASSLARPESAQPGLSTDVGTAAAGPAAAAPEPKAADSATSDVPAAASGAMAPAAPAAPATQVAPTPGLAFDAASKGAEAQPGGGGRGGEQWLRAGEGMAAVIAVVAGAAALARRRRGER